MADKLFAQEMCVSLVCMNSFLIFKVRNLNVLYPSAYLCDSHIKLIATRHLSVYSAWSSAHICHTPDFCSGGLFAVSAVISCHCFHGSFLWLFPILPEKTHKETWHSNQAADPWLFILTFETEEIRTLQCNDLTLSTVQGHVTFYKIAAAPSNAFWGGMNARLNVWALKVSLTCPSSSSSMV